MQQNLHLLREIYQSLSMRLQEKKTQNAGLISLFWIGRILIIQVSQKTAPVIKLLISRNAGKNSSLFTWDS
ncbi:hypothetical protein FGO68_gene11068 [Halteria grandinella]|uniref:Uncharacterized protein n=1 Tax=Halteria grandinella TaxID=5974 RepID=A0A8J8NBI4_HALGN|nr:hypothetical protein FGO68_gene11068 [Halteria grandinella]